MRRAQRRTRKHPPAPGSSAADSAEVAKFAALAGEWWNPAGKFAPLHRLNPLRLRFIRGVAATHFGRDAKSLRSFDGLSLLDIGCGGGLLSEPMARQGFSVLGADPAETNVRVAAVHAGEAGLGIDYRRTTAEALAEAGMSFDVVLNMEVVEHVPDIAGHLAACTSLVVPGGLIFVATINKTLKALALAKIGAEYVLGWIPPGTHDWNRFIAPGELRELLEAGGMSIVETQGVGFDLFAWNWHFSRDTDVNYLVAATRP